MQQRHLLTSVERPGGVAAAPFRHCTRCAKQGRLGCVANARLVSDCCALTAVAVTRERGLARRATLEALQPLGSGSSQP